MNDLVGILGGGLAGLSLANLLDGGVTVLEAQEDIGGLCRSYCANGVVYDVGPHIIFSKNKHVLDLMNTVSDNHTLKRVNHIYHKGKFIKYPFENFLAQLQSEEEIDYCLNSFLNNPYCNMPSKNMLAFFLKTFGEGITRLYLQPYNQKIWKFDPSMMDTQMVERIPRPPDQDIIDAAAGNFKEGYLHQLYFNYPKQGGIQSLCRGFYHSLKDNKRIITNQKVIKIIKLSDGWKILTEKGDTFFFEKIINCMPIHETIRCMDNVPYDVIRSVENLIYNSIFIILLNFKQDFIGNCFAIMLAQPDISFHRLSRINFLGQNYCLPDGSSTISLEVTLRVGDSISQTKPEELVDRSIKDLVRLGFAKREDLNFYDVHYEKYAYVIYDLNHKRNCRTVREYLHRLGIPCNGRFAEFEYLNMDRVIEHSLVAAKDFNESWNAAK